ncbi:gamma-glutamyl-gamma-aminobutyrate hydrolase family protein [Rhodovarius lipocyclicus]|uniref:gamma-glutamyl-gamma-aminobutyrate hydrolase family protein n=1 Tax=Rhodovarius lipocyclicus TaxID=268410 RepID=UPI001358ACE5|nr:gamma-glutamyl-gamma-aminobutyrate hydrolase family protein [Rhodovarius lipocyclicus]
MRPLIGISCCVKPFGIFNTPNHAASDSYVKVVMGPVGGIPALVPCAGPECVNEIVARMDGIIMTGSRSNVWPEYYGGPPHLEGTPEDHQRDATTLPLIRAAIDNGIPLLAICRGMQELNVALGGSLDQRIQDLDGRMDHSTPSDQHIPLVRTGKAHNVRLKPNTLLARLSGRESIAVNSLHNQGVQRLAPGLVAEAWAPDGTVEAVRVEGARAFAMGVQWHPEYDWERDELSLSIFQVFAEACQARMEEREGRKLQAAE